MRAVICKTFPAYTFKMIDQMSLQSVIEIYTSAEWMAEEEKRLVDKASRKHR